MSLKVNDSQRGVTFGVKLIPRARRNEIVGIEGDALKVRLNAPPIEGRANEALIKFLAEALGVARGDVEILLGESSRRKIVRVRGLSANQLMEIMQRVV